MTIRVCDLKLDIKKSHLYPRILHFYKELKRRQLLFAPQCYFADEWFVPEGDPVIGIPFYLANNLLSELERKMMGEAEGDKARYFLKLLRHEAGHAISYAYKLHRKKLYKKIFGASSKLFSELYTFNRQSKKYVLHLDDHYAQSHPDEDFAETFAVWLYTPESIWRRKYKGWPVLKKLQYMAFLMKGIRNKSPIIRSGEKMCQVSTLKYTLWTYYMRRRSLLEHHERRKRS